MVVSAFKSGGDFFSSLFLPAGHGFLGVAWDRLTLGNFRRLFNVLPMARALLNSVFLASACSLFATACGAMGGYGLAKFTFRGRAWLTTLVLGTAVLPMPLLLAPRFELLFHLRLLDTYAGYLLPQLAPAFGVYLFRQAMINQVPNEIIESARLDGCGEIRIFFTLVLPLVRPMVGAFIVITFLGVWNDFIGPQIILQSPERMPLAVTLASLQNSYATDYGLMMAGTVVSVAPIICLFLLLQKEFISGLTSGTVKG
jgi:ABC-type glycerol-3-phosphate transport system permease component